MSKYLLGIDIGGTGIKAGVFSSGGDLLHVGRRNNRILSKKPGFAEFSPISIWENIISLINECSRESCIEKNKITSIGLSSTCPAVVAMDKKGRPLRDVIMNFDNRSSRQVEDTLKHIDSEYIFEITGNRLLSGAISASTILWIKEKEPGIYNDTNCFGHITTYIIHRLTEKFVLDYTQASFTGFFRTREKFDWDMKLLKELGIDKSKLPALLPPEKALEGISEKASLETGLNPDICIAPGAADTVCSALGAGVTEPDQVFVSSGTSEILSGVMEVPDFERRFLNRTYIDGKWIYHAAISTSGAALSWVKNTFFDPDINMKEFYLQISYSASRSEAGSGGLYFLPYLQGERSPWWDSDARGVFLGLSLNTSRGDIFRSVLEGIGYALRQNLEIAEKKAGHKYHEILFTGGGSRNELWLQIKSDITGKVLKVMEFNETAILGAALLGGICSGMFKVGVEASELMGKRNFKFIEPDMEKYEKYSRYSERFSALYLALKPEFKKIRRAD